MAEESILHPIAHIRSDFASKFGIPRQSGVVEALTARVVFVPEFRSRDALRGIEDFSHLWLIWEFSAAKREGFTPTVRPPRLGGNERMGVFATRSPFRPNSLGLSCVRLLRVEETEDEGTVLLVSGTDMMDGTPIYDIKPYLPYTDAHPEARGGFAQEHLSDILQVEADDALMQKVPPEKREALLALLRQDPRPAYQHDPDRVYGFPYGEWEVRFTVRDGTLTVTEIEKR